MKDHLVTLIEAKLGWGNGDTWSNKDFEELSERILKQTNKRLSVTTLKRIWGRAEWVANPSAATMDILSEFLGFENWRDFVSAHKEEPTEQKVLEKPKPRKTWTIVLAVAIVGSFFGFYWNTTTEKNEQNTVYKAEDFLFKSRTISQGIPNSVVFEYHASLAKENAKIEIQQDWDRNKRMRIDKRDTVATSIYYHPGFFKSKLVVDDTIIKENDVFITTDNWLGMIERDSVPIYLTTKEIYADSLLGINHETVTAYNLDARTSNVVVSLYQVKDFGDLYTKDFEMSTEVKNDFDEGISACQNVRLFILYDGGAIGIPLAKKGCSSDLTLMTMERFVDGKKNDLSGFGVDFNDYVNLRCISKNQKLEIFIDNKSIYQMNVPEPAQKIKGVSIHFEGAGSVKTFEFKRDEEIIYKSGF
ncbi:hypothetical protein FEE95_18520 [Maribacter algarum]|uniref:Uncharacterized protein n=1 Tax=Maribacter algarum (ex Zhang et al. 2020) TaxID=2578118 RepID=A0A5S3PI61_9FLAO|nr:hypothetical protein [Maribacter algarum]TMM53892.1 hypothetical protein FEE95_18520 [Maribacter algarum]